MQFVADENVDPRIIARLRLDGHYIYSIYESNRGLKNGEVLALANQRQAVLITEDKDFGEMLQREGCAAVGVVLVRLPDKTVPLEQKVEMVARTIDQCGLRLQGSLTIIKPEGVRSRPLEQQLEPISQTSPDRTDSATNTPDPQPPQIEQ